MYCVRCNLYDSRDQPYDDIVSTVKAELLWLDCLPLTKNLETVEKLHRHRLTDMDFDVERNVYQRERWMPCTWWECVVSRSADLHLPSISLSRPVLPPQS